MICPTCSRPTPEGAAFCPSCGAGLAAIPTTAGRGDERRVVTVLFADVVGFTGMAERRDPEQVKQLIDGCLQRLVADIDAHGGRVDKILGDGVLALFGAPVAHEDDAERGVRTGLAMHATVEAYAAASGVPVRLRVGVATGEVLVGALRAGGDYTALGDVVNLASRLQSEAPPGAVLVAAGTHAITKRVIAYEPFGPLQVRGRVEAVDTWLAVEPLALPGARAGRRLPLVGRDDELAALMAAASLAVERRRPLVIAVEGEGGMGKSRLAEELVDGLAERTGTLTVAGRCLPYGETAPLAPLAFAIRPVLGLSDDGAVERAAVEEAVRRTGSELPLPMERVVDALLHLLGSPSPLDALEPASAVEEVVRGLAATLASAARRQAIAIRLGDLHWADAILLDVLAAVLRRLPSVPVVIITTARPEEGQAWPPIGARHSTFLLRLDPLNAADAEELASLALGDADDPVLRSELMQRSGGNPLFIEQLAALVAEVGPDAAGPALPQTLRGLVAARLDALAPDERAMLDNAAVLGASGRWRTLERFGIAMNQRPRRATLEALASADLLVLEGNGWRFRSPTVREVAYQTLTKTVRAQRHAGVAAAIEDMARGKTDAAEVLAHHWTVAAMLLVEIGAVPGVPADVIDRAVHWSFLAARHALERQSAAQAERFADAALGLLAAGDHPASPHHATDVPRARRRLLLARGEARLNLHHFDAARADLDAVFQSAADAPETVTDKARGFAQRLLGLLEYQTGRADQALVTLAAAVDNLRHTDDTAALAEALRTQGRILVLAGYADAAEAPLAEAQELYTALGDQRGLAWVNQHRAWTAFVKGARAEADARLEDADVAFSSLGDHNGRSWVLGLRAFIRFQQGRLDDAEALASLVLREAEEHDDKWAASMMRVLLGGLRLWSGRVADALAMAEKARSGFRSLGDRYGEAQAAGLLVRAEVAGGQAADAGRELERLAAVADTDPRRAWVALVTAGAAAHAGDARRALAAADAALATGALDGIGLAELWSALAVARLQLGDVDGALEAASRATELDPESVYPKGVAAMALVASGAVDEAIDCVTAVLGHPGASYLDRVTAASAGALARVASGELDAAGVLLADVYATAATAEDVLVGTMAHVTGELVGAARAGAPMEVTSDVLPQGWSTAWSAMAAGAEAVRRDRRQPAGTDQRG